jgi:hypothetical protein
VIVPSVTGVVESFHTDVVHHHPLPYHMNATSTQMLPRARLADVISDHPTDVRFHCHYWSNRPCPGGGAILGNRQEPTQKQGGRQKVTHTHTHKSPTRRRLFATSLIPVSAMLESALLPDNLSRQSATSSPSSSEGFLSAQSNVHTSWPLPSFVCIQ